MSYNVAWYGDRRRRWRRAAALICDAFMLIDALPVFEMIRADFRLILHTSMVGRAASHSRHAYDFCVVLLLPAAAVQAA